MASELRLALGGIEFLLGSEEGALLRIDDVYRSFLPPTGAEPQDVVRVVLTIEPRPSLRGRVIFESSATWSILADGRDRLMVFRRPLSSDPLYVARFRPGSPEVLVHCGADMLESGEPCPFRYPLDQVLLMYLLGERGFVLHAAGLVVDRGAIAFAGVSGAGKTTIAGLAAGRAGWSALSDDRVIVESSGSAPTLHGTPWPGEGQVAENRSVALARILFLEHGAADEVRRLEARDVLARLVRTVSLPWYDAEYLASGLAACERIQRSTPCLEFRFRREREALDAVERLLVETG